MKLRTTLRSALVRHGAQSYMILQEFLVAASTCQSRDCEHQLSQEEWTMAASSADHRDDARGQSADGSDYVPWSIKPCLQQLAEDSSPGTARPSVPVRSEGNGKQHCCCSACHS